MPNLCARLVFVIASILTPLGACSTIESGGTGADAGATFIPPATAGEYDDGADETVGEMPAGPENTDYCIPNPAGSPFAQGWQIACTASSVTRSFVNPLDESFVELEDFSGPFGHVCCGGGAPVEEADANCQLLCLRYICEAARAQHVAWAVDVSNDGAGGNCLGFTEACGFDFDLCTTGTLHEQVAGPGELFSYFLQAECEAIHDQVVSPYENDEWNWVQVPNDASDDPPVCAPPPDPEPGPPEQTPEHEVEEEPGTSVTLTWSVASGSVGSEQSLEAEVDLAYAVNPCASGDCLALSRLHIALPDGTYQGLLLENLHLMVEQAAPPTPLAADGNFSFASKALRATLSLTVEGAPLVITGYNEGRVRGVASPHAGTMILSSLVFGFDDGVIAAELALNINGAYVRHAPDAVVKVVDSPTSCTIPVTFEAASTDLDDDPLTHVWWVPPWFVGTGTLLEARLPPGSYRVFLTSVDSTGRSDSTALEYVRSCQ